MVTILEFSDEPKYSIKYACSQTGIRAVTLRAWERRYGLLSPHRSENRYRLYSQRDLEVLRWIKSRVDHQVSISNAVSEFKAMIRDGIWPDAIPIGPSILPIRHTELPDRYTRRLFQALIKHEEPSASEIMREAFSAFSLMTIYTEIITPTLVNIGEAWFRGEIRITTEHFASTFIRGKLMSMLQSYPSPKNRGHILLGSAPSEHHEIGSLMMAVLLRSVGFRVEYLGPDIPLNDLVAYASVEHPEMIVLTATLEPAAIELAVFQEKLARIHPAPIFCYAGRAFDLKPDLRNKTLGNYLGNNMEMGLAMVRKLFQGRY